MLNLLHLYLDGAVAFAAVTTMMAWLRSGRVLARFTALAPFWPVVVGLWASDTFSNRRRDRKPIGPTPEPNPFLLAAQREVDAMLPGTPPIAPPPATAWQLEQARGAQGVQAGYLAQANQASLGTMNQQVNRNQLNSVCMTCGGLDGYCPCSFQALLHAQQGTRRTN